MAIKSLAQTLKDLTTEIKNTVTDITSSNATLTITKCNGTTSTVTVNNALKANGHTVNADVPANAKFTDTTYGTVTDSESGLMTAAQKQKLDELSNYSLPVASATTLGGVKIGDGLTITDGVLSSGVTGGNATHGEQLFTANGTFVVPEGVSILVVTAVGGGGGGGGGGENRQSSSGSAGVRGEACDYVPLFVTPLASYQVHVGIGGKGGSPIITGGAGGAGIVNGGRGADGSRISGVNGTRGGGGGGGGGASGIANTILARGGSGGGGGGGTGGTGGTGATKTLGIPSITTSKHINPSYGAAGGGGGHNNSGGKGADGCVYIVW